MPVEIRVSERKMLPGATDCLKYSGNFSKPDFAFVVSLILTKINMRTSIDFVFTYNFQKLGSLGCWNVIS